MITWYKDSSDPTRYCSTNTRCPTWSHLSKPATTSLTTSRSSVDKVVGKLSLRTHAHLVFLVCIPDCYDHLDGGKPRPTGDFETKRRCGTRITHWQVGWYEHGFEGKWTRRISRCNDYALRVVEWQSMSTGCRFHEYRVEWHRPWGCMSGLTKRKENICKWYLWVILSEAKQNQVERDESMTCSASAIARSRSVLYFANFHLRRAASLWSGGTAVRGCVS